MVKLKKNFKKWKQLKIDVTVRNECHNKVGVLIF